ncbi:MAG: helix-turn-helix transcriptional regulator [Prevotella sp.]|nr:helix-turn-helix transcriptional regulator [Prevotella sp.]
MRLASGQTDFDGLTGHVVSVQGCTLLYCERGMAIASSFAGSQMVLRHGSVVILFEDLNFVVSCVSKLFSYRYVEIAHPSITDLFYKFASAEFWEFVYRCPVLLPQGEVGLLTCEWFRRVDWIVRTFEGSGCLQAVRGELQNFLIAIDKLRPAQPTGCGGGGSSSLWLIVGRLNTLLLHHIRHERSVKFYASELCISADYLNRVCQRVLGKSTKTIINEMSIRQIKILLTDTSLTVTEIASRLNYDNVSYLCRFFRNATGCSMLEYRDGKGRFST